MAQIKRQTLLFSATIMFESNTFITKSKKKNKQKKIKSSFEVLSKIIETIGQRGKPSLCHIQDDQKITSQKSQSSDKLRENHPSIPMASIRNNKSVRTFFPEDLTLCSAKCLDKTKDAYLYYFLTQYNGRCLVFVNTISVLRRISRLLKILKINNVYNLHADLLQKQRIKQLENFTKNESAVLVATDVAARGLDVNSVHYVIQFSLPARTDAFIHRAGRTARAGIKGLCLSLVCPSEEKRWKNILYDFKYKPYRRFPHKSHIYAYN